MFNFLLIIFCIWLFIKFLPKSAPTIKPVKSNCPPHSWSWKDVYNEDGSLHHRHLVCAKCGPLHGVNDD